MCADSAGASATQAEKEEVDSRSIYVGNVRVLLSFALLNLVIFNELVFYHVNTCYSDLLSRCAIPFCMLYLLCFGW